ncbi:MAG: SAM-dependent methyltransferase [Bacteroidota bacterium]
MEKGKLYLIPTTLGEGALQTIPAYVIEQLHQLEIFIVEKGKTARHFIKATDHPTRLQEMTWHELNKHTPVEVLPSYLAKAREGKSIGLLSEAGCPGVADPGAAIVEIAHREGIEVVPLVGPSSLLLALMASGMNGQQFCFQGYLSVKTPELIKDLKRLEQLAQRHRQTQIFIETPYRNGRLVEQMLSSLSANTKLCIACDLTLPTQYVRTQTIKAWRKTKLPELHKRPTVFLIG